MCSKSLLQNYFLVYYCIGFDVSEDHRGESGGIIGIITDFDTLILLCCISCYHTLGMLYLFYSNFLNFNSVYTD